MPACSKCNAEFDGLPTRCPSCKADLSAGSLWLAESAPFKPFEQTVPTWQWLLYGAVAAACFLYATYGLVMGEMYLPGKRGASQTLHGSSAMSLAAAFLCIAIHLSMSLLGYPGRPDATKLHEAFAKYTKYAAIALFFVALLTQHQS